MNHMLICVTTNFVGITIFLTMLLELTMSSRLTEITTSCSLKNKCPLFKKNICNILVYIPTQLNVSHDLYFSCYNSFICKQFLLFPVKIRKMFQCSMESTSLVEL
jgi:hypothetical protein